MADDFDSLFEDDSFDDNDSLDFGDSDNVSFDDGDSGFDNADIDEDQEFDGDEYDNMLENSNNTDEQNNEAQKKKTKKSGWIFVVIGLVAVVIIFIIASKVFVKKDKSVKQLSNNDKLETAEVETNDIKDSNEVEEDVPSNQEVIDEVVENSSVKDEPEAESISDDSWIEVDNKQKVEFKEENVDMTFTITKFKHLARTIDADNNINIITRLTGSISGLSGTYTIDIPYNKGIKVDIGDSFTVHVQIGAYQGKTVVGSIQY